MSQTSKENLKKYFETGDKPTQTEYAELINAMRHVDDKLPIADVESLQASLDSKATAETLLNHMNDNSIHGITLTGSDIKTAYEAEANTNAFTDTEKQQVADSAVHVSDSDSHVSAADKTNWNAKLDAATYSGSAQDLKDEIDTKIALNSSGNPLKFFNELGNAVEVPVSSYATTIYIDSSITDSSESTLNEKSKPFKTMLDGKNALTGFESAIRYHFINNATHEGCELGQIDTEFNADSKATIDFTNVNQGGSVIANVYDINFTPTFHFIGGRVSIVSNSDGANPSQTHSFTPQFASHPHETYKYKVILSGHIGKIDWRALPEPMSGINYTGNFLFATGTTNLIINEFVSSDPQSSDKIFAADDYSTITFRKISHISGASRIIVRNYHNSSGTEIKWFFNSVNIPTGTLSFYILGSYQEIIGSGTINVTSAIYDNCAVDSTITLRSSGGTHKGKITTNTPLTSSYASGILTFQDFEGYLSNIDMHSIHANCGMVFKGSNKIYVASGSKIANVNYIQDTHRLNVVQVLDGITVIEHEDPTGYLYTGGGATKVLDIRSMLLTNCQNIGLTVNYFNNELRVYP